MIKFILTSILSGVIIGLAGFLYVCTKWICEDIIKINYLREIFNIIGSIIFSFGLLIICKFELNLFTGKVGKLFESENYLNKCNFTLQLIFILIINLIFAICLGVISNVALSKTYYMVIIQKIVEDKSSFVNLNSYILTLLQSIFCGLCVSSAVKTFEFNVLFCSLFVSIFVYNNFQHCIANAFYFGALYNKFSYYMLINEAIVIVGNIIGSIPISILTNHIYRKYLSSASSSSSFSSASFSSSSSSSSSTSI